MPLTLSHPAAAVPLRRLLGRYGSLPALVLGSMAPDFPYYLFVDLHRNVTHTLPSVLWFSIPATCAAFVLFDRFLRKPLHFLLPGAIRTRLPVAAPSRLTPGLLLAVIVSGAAGALTHLAWDSFTHTEGAIVLGFPALRSVSLELAGLKFPVYDLLQVTSTIAGLALLALWVRRWMERTPPRETSHSAPFSPGMRTALLCSGAIVALSSALAAGALRTPARLTGKALLSLLRYAAVSAVASVAALLLLFALAWVYRARSQATD